MIPGPSELGVRGGGSNPPLPDFVSNAVLIPIRVKRGGGRGQGLGRGGTGLAGLIGFF